MRHTLQHSLIKTFSHAGMVLLLAACCALAGFIIVCPLWLFAVRMPAVYTWTVLAALGFFIVYMVFRVFRTHPLRSVLRVTLHVIIVAGGLSAATALVFAGCRFAAIPVLILIPVLYMLSTFFCNRK